MLGIRVNRTELAVTSLLLRAEWFVTPAAGAINRGLYAPRPQDYNRLIRVADRVPEASS
jgi:hypothetical protein